MGGVPRGVPRVVYQARVVLLPTTLGSPALLLLLLPSLLPCSLLAPCPESTRGAQRRPGAWVGASCTPRRVKTVTVLRAFTTGKTARRSTEADNNRIARDQTEPYTGLRQNVAEEARNVGDS